MRSVARALALLLAMGSLLACSELPPPEPPPPGPTIACTNDRTEDISFLDWELIVTAEPRSGEPFTATLDGVALFPEDFLDAVQDLTELFPEGVKEVALVDLKATVHVRSGTTGSDDVVLTVEPIPYKCSIDKNSCDPANDLPGDPGLRGNTDCEPQADFNPCSRFVSLPISTDCLPDGICDGLRKAGPGSQCDRNEFCVTRDLPLRLQEKTGQYTADVQGDVLFGWWEDQKTDDTIRQGGLNEGTWILPEADYFEPMGPISMRVTAGGVPVALECTMGVNCSDPDLGTDCLNSLLSSPTPDSALISRRIQTEAF